ncbi:MAG: NosD domain-containing protein [Polyangiaceae bacterium]
MIKTTTRRHFFAAILLALTWLSVPGTASAELLALTANRTLTADHMGNIRFDANNITLDCTGHQIVFANNTTGTNCTGSGNGKCGIMVFDRKNITIRNCHVVGGFAYGILVSKTNTANLINSSTSGAVIHGTYLATSQNVLVDTYDSMHNGQNGFQFIDVTSSALRYTWGWENTRDGFDDGASAAGTTSGSTGLEFLQGFVPSQRVEAFGNTLNGFEADFAATNHVFYPGTVASGNGQHGFSFDDSSALTLLGVSATGNHRNGLRLQNTDNSVIDSSTFQGNTCDIWENSASTGNQWTNDVYSTDCNPP